MNAHLLHGLVDGDHNETVDAYAPQDEFLRVARANLPADWTVVRNGIWFQCAGAGVPPLPVQGWKIHVSATLENSTEILAAVIRVCEQRRRSFKFALDRRILSLMSSKQWNRGGAGKFITIYPLDVDDFKALLEDLYGRLRGYAGPYVLSDRRYRDCAVLYYRYGGIRPNRRLAENGEQTPVLVDPTGAAVRDERNPSFAPPAWASDPFPPDSAETEGGAAGLGGGRYTVVRALAFSNTGGVYVATTADGTEVVVKEGRPHTGASFAGGDTQTLLEKEFRLLTRLEGTGVAPRAIDIFRDWEHLFLVEELVPGTTLQRWNVIHNGLLQAGGTRETRRRHLLRLERLWTSLAGVLRTLHDRGIVFGDLSPNNVMVTDADRLAVKLIDFEGAREIGTDAETGLRTPGFASRGRRGADPAEDRYALGAVMLHTLWPINPVLDLAPQAKRALVTTVATDNGLSVERTDLLLALLDDNPAARPSLDTVIDTLRSAPLDRARRITPRTRPHELPAILDDMRAYTLATADTRSRERLFPADPKVFATNPMGVAHGACGVALALMRTHGEVPRHLLGWMLQHNLSSEAYPPGLHVGLSGVAWVMAELGYADIGERLIASVATHPLLLSTAELGHGVAGCGMAFLRFHQLTGEQPHLDAAVRLGAHLLQSSLRVDTGRCWRIDGQQPISLGYGASGVALFLLSLHAATGDAAWLHAGREALDFVLAQAVTTNGGRHMTFRRDRGGDALVPYLLDGSAGIGSVVLRYHAVTGDPALRPAIDALLSDVRRRYTIYPGLFLGLAGLATFLLDCYDILGGEEHLRAAERVVDGLMLYRVDRPAGIAFPGDRLSRLSTDYATGSAGISLVLHRLVSAQRSGISSGNANFMLDDLLAPITCVQRAPSTVHGGPMRVIAGGGGHDGGDGSATAQRGLAVAAR